MDDLVERLRACGDPDIDVYVFEEAGPGLLREAADRIEELEKVACGTAPGCWWVQALKTEKEEFSDRG